MAEHRNPEVLRDYDNEPLPPARGEVESAGFSSILGNLGWVALDPGQPGTVIRAYAGLRQVLNQKPQYMNQEVVALHSAQSKRTMFASKGHRQDGDVVVAFGEPSVADRLCRLGFQRTPGDHRTFVTDERTGRVSAKADAWTFEDTADLPLYSRARLLLINKRHEPAVLQNNYKPTEGQICDLLSRERLLVITRPSAEAWTQPGGNSQKRARAFNDTAFRLWLVLLCFFSETPLGLTPALIAEVFEVSCDTARRALAYLASLSLVEPIAPSPVRRSLLYRWDLRAYLAKPYTLTAMGDLAGRRVDYPWRDASLGNKPPRRGSLHVEHYFDQTYAQEAARKKAIGKPFTQEPEAPPSQT